MSNPPIISRLISIQEAATYIGLSPHTLYTMVSQRRIPFVKVGRLVKFDLDLDQAVYRDADVCKEQLTVC